MCLPSVSHRCDQSLSLCALHLPICTGRILNVWWRDTKKRQKKQRKTEMQTTAILVKKNVIHMSYIFITWLLLPHAHVWTTILRWFDIKKVLCLEKKTMKLKLAMLSFYWGKWVSESAQGVIHYFSQRLIFLRVSGGYSLFFQKRNRKMLKKVLPISKYLVIFSFIIGLR